MIYWCIGKPSDTEGDIWFSCTAVVRLRVWVASAAECEAECTEQIRGIISGKT